MVSSEPSLAVEEDYFSNNMKEMIGGCCVCSDERGWAENPLVYCDGHGCNVAVHQACYGIVQVPTGPWFCRKCESQERAARVIKGWKGRKSSLQSPDGGGRSAIHDAEEEGLAKSLKTLNIWRCELCPHKDGALKRTDNGGWAHVVCALYIPEVEFANVSTMEPIVLQSVPHERYNKTCYICEEQGRESKAATGACMNCNKHGCRQAFHVTCAQFAGLLCEEQGSDADNVKYCGYCKYHYSKLKHKERDKHKPKHKKTIEPSPVLVPTLTVTTEKTYTSSSGGSGGGGSVPNSLKRLDDTAARFTNANFQEVPAHAVGGKDGGAAAAEGKGSEGKGKRTAGHSSGQRGRKAASGKPPISVTVTAATSTSPFQQGSLLGTPSSGKSASASAVQSPQEFPSFAESDLRNDSYAHSQQPSFTRAPSKGESAGQEGGLNAFSSLMALPSVSSGAAQAKSYENSQGDLSGPAGLAPAGYKRPQPSLGAVEEDDAVKGKKRRGNWRNKYGPGRSRGNKAQEAICHLPASSASPASSVASGAGSVTGTGAGGGGSANTTNGTSTQKSPTLLRNGSLQNLSVSSSPAGPGAFPSGDVLVSLPSAVSASSCSTPLRSSELPQQTRAPPPPPAPSLLLPPTATPLSSVVCTQANALPGSSFNLAPSHMFGNRLNPNSAMAALIAQSENSPADQELGDNSHSLAGRGSSPKGSVSPRNAHPFSGSSPASGLQIRYDQSGGGGGGGVENVPPVATSIEQLLERQWSEGQQFLFQQGTPGDILGMLKSLHQLQVENRRLEEQIKTLTVKKERLQLLSAQLSVPFPSAAPSPGTPPQLPPPAAAAAPPPDVLSSRKSPQLSSSYLPDSSLPLTIQDVTSSGQSTTSSSTLSTPPPVGHSPPQPGSGVAAVQQVNGVTVGTLAGGMQTVTSTIPAMPGVTGLIGAIQGGQLAMNGIVGAVGALNGVIQTPPSITQNPSSLPHAAVPPNVSLPIPSTLNNSAPGLGLLSDQQRQLLLHQHQLQQLLSSQQPIPEQHQALLYQLMQHQQQQQHHHHHHHQHQQQQQHHELQQLQLSAAAQLPMNSLLPTAQGAITANPFLAMHADPAAQKTPRLTEKTGPVVQEKS
ncbi:protein AF-10 isoform X2 [Lepisosteus oculatus]|uniref:protein AF-10 isoform X2 n=1 Tax=Lepisosteus oculatus TaxID=7918 RepID=UPI0037138F2D